MSRIVISIGGNALSNNPITDAELLKPVAKLVVEQYKKGNNILLTTGNGPQCGEIYDIFTDANKYNSKHNALSLDEINAITQSYIGYHVIKAVTNELLSNSLPQNIACVETIAVVDEKDEAWKNPTKPIGDFFSTLADAKKAYPNDSIVDDSGRGFRKVVASPKPQQFIGINAIKQLFESKTITIASIGGGIPCIIENSKLVGKEGVIDKDYSTCALAEFIGADILLVLTGVENVYLNWNKPNKEPLHKVTTNDVEKFLSEYDFGKGSMEPKLKAASNFVKSTGKIAIITNLENASNAIELKAGTIISC
ncbi:MAG: carbamate kinase [Mycoplasmataceae bacterium]|jgi:carbamate kinase|nr:carbamate kinase [Mycoplasmataceae bacterium]